MKDQKVQINVELTFTPHDINDILTTAFEGGINYWCSRIKTIKENGNPKGVAYEDLDDQLLFFHSGVIALGGEIILYDSESDEMWQLTLPMILNGIKIYCEMDEVIDKEEIICCDADVADRIVQYAIFGKLIFG